MPPLYSGSADEWSYLSTSTTGTAVTVEFIVDNFTSQMIKPSTLKSHQFSVKETLWHIKVVPESKFEDRKGHVGVFIHNENDEDINVRCKFIISNEECAFEDTIKKECGKGFPMLITHQECKKCLSDGKFTVKVEMSVLEEERTLIHGKGKQILEQASSDVDLKIFEDKIFTDFLVVCSGKSFPCHKAFLAAGSPVFMTMIESNMKEAKESTLKIGDCTEVVAESFVEYFYTGKVDTEVLNENSVSFLNLSEKYDVKKLKAMVEQIMIANLDTENMLSFFLAGDLYHGKKLRAAAKNFLKQNKRSLKEKEDWKEALKERLDLLLELMESFM
eukprot:GFUD01044036.1.p1 GENE.GFUD01044036.1~~GFUD01044036.1.p1  ORF type:complete len:331 (+),score=86.37 GFUD01044036.1:120-1112(+)